MAKEVVENIKLLDGLGERRIASCWIRGGGGDGRQDMRWEEVERQREIGRREDGETLDEDIRDALLFSQVRVELVSVESRRSQHAISARLREVQRTEDRVISDRANKVTSRVGGIHSPVPIQVIGNVKKNDHHFDSFAT